MRKVTIKQMIKLCEKIERHSNADRCDEFCFYASHKCDNIDDDVQYWTRAIKDIDETIEDFEKAATEYVAKLMNLQLIIAENIKNRKAK